MLGQPNDSPWPGAGLELMASGLAVGGAPYPLLSAGGPLGNGLIPEAKCLPEVGATHRAGGTL